MVVVLVGCFVGLGSSRAPAQGLPPAQPPTSQDVERPIQLDTIAARKAAVQTQIDALGAPDPQKKEQEEARLFLDQILNTLITLEETLQKQATYTTQIADLPRRLQELERESTQLERSAPSNFSAVTEQLRDEYQSHIQTAQNEIQELIKQTVAGEVRLASIPKEIEQRVQARARLEKELSAVRQGSAEVSSQVLPQYRAELRALQLQLQETARDALQAEREWLIKQIPLQDALLKVAQVRLERLQQDLDSIKQALGQALQEEQTTLSDTAATMTQQMEQSLDPVAAFVLGTSLETVEIRRATADYRQQFHELSDDVLAQEKQNAQLKQDINRLTALMEKYASGEVPAGHLLSLFERLQRERVGYRDTPVAVLQGHLRVLNEQLFSLDDLLYEFDSREETALADLTVLLSLASAEEQEAAVTEVRQLLDEQRAALRDQQQTLTALVQEVTKLLTLHREYKRQLDEGYLLALNRMFWLRDGEPFSWATFRDALAGGASTGVRLYTVARAAPAYLQDHLFDSLRFWFMLLLVLLVLPWVAYGIHKHLKTQVTFSLADHAERKELPSGKTAALIVIRAAIWPAYLALIAWGYEQVFAHPNEPADLALVRGVQLSALILWVALLSRGILRRNGWAQRFWGFSPELCRLLHRTVLVVCVAAFICLVPRSILLMAPGGGSTALGSLALARLLLLTFQGVMLVLVAIVGRRSSLLMQTVLAQSRENRGFLWRVWPFLHVALLSGVSAIMMLDILGRRYTAEFLWFRMLGSLAVILLWGLMAGVVLPWAFRKLTGYAAVPADSGEPDGAISQSDTARYVTLTRVLCNLVLVLVAVGGILEVWGLTVSWVLTSPAVSTLLARTFVIAVTVGITLVILQISKALTESLLQSKTSRDGVMREAGRKLKTLAPLVQTVIRVMAIFIAALVILEQLGVDTGPVLAGVGIFGLAVGFASQSLIKDVINGLFILFEDSLSVGDVVTLRGIGGQVEKFTLRAVTLRDLSGNVHVIPNSSFDMVTNFTKDYSRYLLDVGVAYREDVDTVISTLREIDEEMRHDPEYGRDMLGPLEVLGVDRFEDSAVIIRARLTTRPIQQWRVGREFNRRMKKVFDERGIEIPFPHRTLYWGVPKEKSQPPIHVAMENHKPPLLGEQGGD